MQRLTALIFVAALAGCEGPQGEQGEQGPQGEPGPGGDPSVSAVIPDAVFAGRVERVTIAGFATSWDSSTTVSFGDGVTVIATTVASPTAIVATIGIDADADAGFRDVTVTAGDSTTTYAGVFEVSGALDVTNIDGTQAQGSIMLVNASMLDLSTPFDATMTGDGFFTPIDYPNTIVSSGEDVSWLWGSVSAFSLDGLALVDVTAATGERTLQVDSGPEGHVTTSLDTTAMTIEARTPTMLTDGQELTVPVVDAYESHLYQVDVPAGARLKVSASSAEYYAVPAFALLPESGSFDEMLDYGDSIIVDAAAEDATYYLVYWDNYGFSGYEYDMTVEAAVPVPDNNDSCATAEVLGSIPVSREDAGLSDELDQDWYQVTVGAGDVGTQLHVMTEDETETADTMISVYDGCGSLFFGPYDSGYAENIFTDALPHAGDYYVLVEHAPYPYVGETYDLTVTAEDDYYYYYY